MITKENIAGTTKAKGRKKNPANFRAQYLALPLYVTRCQNCGEVTRSGGFCEVCARKVRAFEKLVIADAFQKFKFPPTDSATFSELEDYIQQGILDLTGVHVGVIAELNFFGSVSVSILPPQEVERMKGAKT